MKCNAPPPKRPSALVVRINETSFFSKIISPFLSSVEIWPVWLISMSKALPWQTFLPLFFAQSLAFWPDCDWRHGKSVDRQLKKCFMPQMFKYMQTCWQACWTNRLSRFAGKRETIISSGKPTQFTLKPTDNGKSAWKKKFFYSQLRQSDKEVSQVSAVLKAEYTKDQAKADKPVDVLWWGNKGNDKRKTFFLSSSPSTDVKNDLEKWNSSSATPFFACLARAKGNETWI